MDEIALIRETVRRLLSGRSMDVDSQSSRRAIWDALHEAGFSQLGSERAEQELPEILAVMGELGRAACDAPLLGAILANFVLGKASPSLSGHAVAYGFGSYDGDRNGGSIRVASDRASGTLRFAENAGEADRFLVIADGGLSVLIEAEARGIAVRKLPGLVQPSFWDVTLDDVEVEPASLTEARVSELHLVARLCLAARAQGATQRGFELVLEHAKSRRQFGQPIGKFQAIQHKLADSRIALDATELLLADAADAAAKARPSWQLLAASAVTFCCQTLRQVAFETHHCFGAIGYAEEHEAPKLFRRVHGDVTRLGGLRGARELLAAQILDSAGNALAQADAGAFDSTAALRLELREWLAQNWTNEDQARARATRFSDRKWDLDFAERLANGGWTTLTWPQSADGQARTPLEQLAYAEELANAGASDLPIAAACRILAPEILAYGSEKLRETILPPMRAGRVSICLGYSEPEAGSDLASLRTKAERRGETYVVNGQKIWTSDGHRATHMLLAARTDWAEGVKHGGISLFVLPMDTPGITVRKSMAMYGSYFCNIFFDDVQVSADMLLGPENGGWAILGNALASERVMIGAFAAQVRALFQKIVAYIKAQGLASDPIVRERIASLAAEVDASRQLTLRSIRLSGGEYMPLAEAAIAKVYASELSQRVTEAAIDLLGVVATLGEECPRVPADGLNEQLLRQSIMMVIGGGTNEIQRNIIAQRGLDLPTR